MIKKRITLNDIAEIAGVSKTTASMILNGQADQFRIKDETREKVLTIAKNQGYRANIHAKALKQNRTNVIGLVIPDLTNYGFALTTKTLERLCRENGLQLVIACSDDSPQQEKAAIERLLDRQIDLLVTAPTHQDPHYYKNIRRHTPLVLLDRCVPNSSFCHIISRDTPYIAALVKKSVETYRLQEYFYFGGQLALSPSASRLAGFREGLGQAGLAEQVDWIVHRDYQPQSGYTMLADTVAQLGRLPQAVFTASYTLLEGVLRYLSEHKLTDKLMNGELHLATFDDHDMLDALPFPIHSIKQNHTQIALQTFEIVQQKLAGKSVENALIDCEIVWRSQKDDFDCE